MANVADLATTMPDGSVRHGTKQFSPGTKLYLTSESHIGMQGLVFVVLGKPRHRNGLIQMFMRCDRMCDFRMKQVYDKRVIEFMTRYKRGHLSLGSMSRSTWGWDDSDESKEEIERWVERFNQEDKGAPEGNEQ